MRPEKCVHYRWIFCYCCVLLFALVPSVSQAAGYRVVEANGIEAGVWYPSDAATSLQRLGPFEANMALDAPIKDGQFKVVLFSHGVGGRYRNHFHTAKALADAGYIVVAPNHRADRWIDGPKRAQVLDDRYLALQKSLEWVQNEADFIPHIDASKVHGVGYSLGGATIMLASGAGFSSTIVDEHCHANAHIDAEFCDGPGFVFRVIQFFRDSPVLRPTTDPFRHSGFITGATVLVAPVYQGLDLAQGLSMANLSVISIDTDVITKPKFHARPLFKAAKQYVPAKFSSLEGHHYGFIAPFPKWLTDEEDIPIAKDPEGFNRLAFIEEVNSLIIDALMIP
jgi:hypothetical protein